MKRNLALVALGFALLLPSLPMYAQVSVDASACDLLRNPKKYANQLVRVRGQVSIGFENFTLKTTDCGEKLRWIWLAYGGDEPTPITSTVNDRTRAPGSVLKANGHSIPLVRDASLDVFRKRVVAQRISGVETIPCDGPCYLYDVTATFSGLFLAAPDNRLGGYGHLGCCHLLVIHQVADVDARRTAVPAGGQFSCSTETWNVGADEAELLIRKRRQCNGLADCRKATTEQMEVIAQHWGDVIDADAGEASGLWTGVPSWHSFDLLKKYSVRFKYQDDKHAGGAVTGAEAARTACEAVVAPYPMTTPIACKNLWLEIPASKETAKGFQKPAAVDDSWRFRDAPVASREVLKDAAKEWGVELAPDLKLDGCRKPMVVQGEQFSWCNWRDPNAMQAFSIQVTRSGSHRHGKGWDSVPWTLTRGNGLACYAEH